MTRMGRKKKAPKPNRARGKGVTARTEAEARFMERALAAYRTSRQRLREARDPIASREAYEGVWKSMDAMGRELIEEVEGEEDDEEPAAFVDELGTWKRVTRDFCTYHTLRGSECDGGAIDARGCAMAQRAVRSRNGAG